MVGGMGSTGDNIGEYRARAAACRAMAEKAAEFPSETRTWLQIAEMWEGLAARSEGGPEGAGEGQVEGNVGEKSGGDGSVSPGEPALALTAVHVEAAHRSPARRAAVIAGFLLLPILALAAFLPSTGKQAATVTDRAATSPPQNVAASSPSPRATPEPPVIAPQPPSPLAETAPAAQPTPERVADATAVQPSPEALSETGSVGQRPEPQPEAAGAEPAAAPPSQQKVAALPGPQRPLARASEAPAEPTPSREKLTGTWWPTACPSPAERKTAVRMELGDNRAKAGAASCTFLKKTQAGPAWTVVAKCSDGKASWTAHIRLVLEGKRLQWASERGSQTYHRCG